MRFASVFAAVALASLAGCVGWDAPDTPVASYDDPAFKDVPRPSPFDGIYQGNQVLAVATADVCPAGSNGLLEVGDGNLILDYTPTIILTFTVQPDGTLHAEEGPVSADGTIAGGQLSLIVHTPDCESHYDFSRIQGM